MAKEKEIKKLGHQLQNTIEFHKRWEEIPNLIKLVQEWRQSGEKFQSLRVLGYWLAENLEATGLCEYHLNMDTHMAKQDLFDSPLSRLANIENELFKNLGIARTPNIQGRVEFLKQWNSALPILGS